MLLQSIVYAHSPERIKDRLSFFRNALAFVAFVFLQLVDLRLLTLFQSPDIHGSNGRLRVFEVGLATFCAGRERHYLKSLNARARNDVVVSGLRADVCSSVRRRSTRIDYYHVQDRTCREQGAFIGLGCGASNCELDALDIR